MDPRGSLTLASERLVLREFTAADAEAVHEYARDRLVTQYMEWGPNDREATWRFLSETIAGAAGEPRKQFTLGVVHAASGAVIGSVAIEVNGENEGILGYVFNRAFWSKGYATEAAGTIVRFGFDELKLARISATCHPDNQASARVLQKVGLQWEGRIKDHLFVRGAWRDSLLFASVR